MNAFKSNAEIIDSPLALPTAFSLTNFGIAMKAMNYFECFIYSLGITIINLIIIMLFSAMSAHFFVRNDTKASQFWFFLMVASMIIPFQSIMIPLVSVYGQQLGWIQANPRLTLIVMYIGFGTPLAVFIYHGFIKSVPEELEEAASIDGCNRWQIFFRIVMPILVPTSVTLGILNVLWIWNDFLLPVLIMQTRRDPGCHQITYEQARNRFKKANSWVDSMGDQIETSPYRLNYHFMAPTGWMNDPNGFIQYNGDYHLFYQFNPYHSSWGPIHWGHAVSNDLVNWQHLPVALAPSEPYDCSDNDIHGCASGTAVIQNDEMVLFYTGHGIGNHPMQVQCAARSQDGIHFEKITENPVVAEVPDSCSEDFRDPKIFRLADQWYMVIGTKKDETGKLALYASNDLTHWDYCGILAEGDGHQGEMWECPDLFNIGQSTILIISPIKDRVNQNPFALFGHFDREKKRFESFGSQILDYGVDFYAPQTMQDDHGRRVLIAWMDNWLTPKPSQPFGWAGAMTIPRELTIGEDGKLRQNPVREVAALRDRYIAYHSFQIDRDFECFGSCSNSSELIAEIDLGGTTATRFGLKVRCSLARNEETEILIIAPPIKYRTMLSHTL